MLAFLVGLPLSLAVSAAELSTAYEEGFSHYRQRHYKQASLAFYSALKQAPSSQRCHYLLANCLVHLDEHKRACEEYRLAFLLDPASETAQYCRRALLGYKKPDPAKDLLKPGSEKEMEEVKELIERQASFEKYKHERQAFRSQQAIRTQLDEVLSRIDQQMQADIQKLHDPIVYTPAPQANRLLALPELLKEKEEQIRAQAQVQKEAAIKEAGERVRPYESWRKDRAALLDEAADNLKSQLEQSAGPSGVKLQAHGTGLYVRYYGKPGQSKYPDTHPATARIREAGLRAPVLPPSPEEAELQQSVELRANRVRELSTSSRSEI